MCGRFAFFAPREAVSGFFGADPGPEFSPRYNICPTQSVYALRVDADGQRQLDPLHWGLVPFWAKDPAIGNRMINARAETLGEKPGWRVPFRRQRCVIPASGFYEWAEHAGHKQPWFIRPAGDELLAFAGLWDRWERPGGGTLESCAIVTTVADEFMARLHARMPVLLGSASMALWLDSRTDEAGLRECLLASTPGTLQAWPVSRAVNNPRNEGPGLLERAPASA